MSAKKKVEARTKREDSGTNVLSSVSKLSGKLRNSVLFSLRQKIDEMDPQGGDKDDNEGLDLLQKIK